MIEITENSELISKQGKIVVDFWAPWCGPCRAIAPILKQLESEYINIKFAKCNVDDWPNIAQNFNIKAIPTVLVINDGNIVQQFVGIQSKSTIEKCLDKL